MCIQVLLVVKPCRNAKYTLERSGMEFSVN